MFGIDVSYHKGNIDWNKIKPNINFAILRLGWVGNKKNHSLDSKFEQYYRQCKKLNIPIGVYVYNYCNSEENARDGAKWAIDKLKNKTLELPVYFDMEDESIQNLGRDKLTSICIAFNTEIEKTGLWAGVYANLYWYNNYLNKEEIKKRYTTWIAHYTDGTDKYKGEYDMWQNSSTGKINGVSSNVDTDYLYRDLISQIGNIKPTNPNDEILRLANEVISGKYGNGEARKKALGDKYAVVQAKVNELMAERNEITYVIKKGDTLSGIAKKFHTTVKELARKNNIKDVNKIYAGDVIKI